MASVICPQCFLVATWTGKNRLSAAVAVSLGDCPTNEGNRDLYNVVFDPDLRPKIVPAPADYARPAAIDIGRTVTRQDMTDWMIQYMENDKLGYIANLWMQCADQEENGSFSAACVKLAELASTAVDFSKTGIVVRFASS